MTPDVGGCHLLESLYGPARLSAPLPHMSVQRLLNQVPINNIISLLALSRHFKFYLRVVRDRGSNSAQKSLYNFTISEPFRNNSLHPKNLLRGADFFGLYQTLLQPKTKTRSLEYLKSPSFIINHLLSSGSIH